MGIQGLLQALKPYVEPVHVSKYSGQRVGIDAYSWLHKGAYGCSWQQLREADTRQNSGGLPLYVTYCMHRIKMLQYNNITPVVVFDGGRLPLKALTEQSRRRNRDENLQKAQQKLAQGDTLSAQEHFQKAVEITPLMAHELVKVLRDEQVEFVVAPYEADAQLAHLARLAPADGGVATIITEDSDLLAYGCKVVLFKMDRFGNGEELSLERILHSHPPPVTGMSFRNFTKDLFLAMCVLAGCDFLASIPGIGVKKAHALLAKYHNIHRVLNKLQFSKHAKFPEGYIANFWQAKAIFTHARVYESETRSLMLLNPLPDELLKEFDGNTEFLGPDLPRSRAKAIAEGQLDPTTMCSFDALPYKTQTTVLPKIPTMETMRASKKEHLLNPDMELSKSLAIRSEMSSLHCTQLDHMNIQHSTGSPHEHYLEALDSLRIDVDAEMGVEPGSASQSTVISDTPPPIDQKFLAELQFIAFSGSHQEGGEVTTQVDKSELGYDPPNNNPFKQQRGGENVANQSSSLVSSVNLEPADDNSGISVGCAASSLCSPADESQVLLFSGEGLTESAPTQFFESELTSVNCSNSSQVSSGPPLACFIGTATGQRLANGNFADLERLGVTTHSNNYQASQSSIESSVLTDISPNIVTVSPVYDQLLAKTPSSASSTTSWDSPQSGGRMGSTKKASRLSKSASRVGRSSIGGKRSWADSFSESRSGRDSGILRFFKPILTPTNLAP